ncbi:MAG: Carbon storage regulator [Candidatus Dichloromethanomonas elyunquensis]|nr:MAG: Carbon storage regulator [Candidatus Dichloromethanomonas elyunquensis]
MLVLSRKVNEKIRIGEDIEITIVAVAGDNVRIGIQAPKDVKILRSEVYEEVQRLNREAVSGTKLQDQEVSDRLKEMLGSTLLFDSNRN